MAKYNRPLEPGESTEIIIGALIKGIKDNTAADNLIKNVAGKSFRAGTLSGPSFSIANIRGHATGKLGECECGNQFNCPHVSPRIG